MTAQLDQRADAHGRWQARQFAPLAVLVLSILVLLAKVGVRGGSGLELTDEGYYLLLMSQPWDSTTTTTQFGFIYHPLYLLAGGNLWLIRLANAALTVGLAWALAWAVLSPRVHEPHAGRAQLGVLSLAFASAGLLVTSFELPQSPSYNTLAFQSMLLGLLALVAIGDGSRRLFAWHVVLGIAGAAGFAAKPTTAAAFGVVALLYLAMTQRMQLKAVLLSAGVALAGVAALALTIDGSITGFAGRLRTALDLSRLLLGGSQGGTVWRLDGITWSAHLQVACAAAVLAMALLAGVAQSERPGAPALVHAAVTVAAAGSILLSLDVFSLDAALERYAGVLTLAIAIGCLLAVLVLHRRTMLDRRSWGLAAVLLVLPYAYAFGSGRPYWMNAQGAGLFWVLAGAVLLAGFRPVGLARRALLSLAGATVLATSFFVFAAMEFPMRQPQPLRMDDSVVALGPEGDTLVVAADMAQYIHTLRTLAAREGFRPGDPLIDFTGHSPGAVYAIGGSAPGIPWLLGGYPGSGAFAAHGLALADCRTLVRAWLLTEPDGPDRVPTDALHQLGLDVQRDYRPVGKAATPKATYKVGDTQLLLAPAGPMEPKVARCEAARERPAR